MLQCANLAAALSCEDEHPHDFAEAVVFAGVSDALECMIGEDAVSGLRLTRHRKGAEGIGTVLSPLCPSEERTQGAKGVKCLRGLRCIQDSGEVLDAERRDQAMVETLRI